MIQTDETFDGTFPFAPHFSEAPGFRMHYVDEGEGEAVVCLHGEPTWSYLYRKFVPPLSRKYRIIAPDHMGFGKSETPQDREYTLRAHVENLEALLDDLELGDITFVLQDWGGPIGGAYTLRHPDRVKRLCLMNTILGYGAAVQHEKPPDVPKPPPLTSSPWFQWVVEGLADGSYETVMTNLNHTIISVMKLIGVSDACVIDRAWVKAYSAPFQSKEECIGAVEFPRDVVENRISEFITPLLGGLDALRKKPAMLAEGMDDHGILPAVAIADFKTLFPKGPVVELENVGHFCQEDAPVTLVALIDQFIQMT